MGKSKVENRVSELRARRGIAATELARRVGANRATIYAIEAGTYVPNTQLALQLARELEVTVEELFSLAAAPEDASKPMLAEVLSASVAGVLGQAVRVCQVGSRWVSVPVSASPYYLPEADGVVKRAGGKDRRAELLLHGSEAAAGKRLVMAGCDPAMGLLTNLVERVSGVSIVTAAASSRLALAWLKEGKVHVAGSHLEDPKTGEFNLPFVREAFAGEDILMVTFARWEEGLVVAAGNPKGIRKVEDLARRGVRFVNREIGSGSRALLDKLLKGAGVPAAKVHGYGRLAQGHLAAAYVVLSGEADCCLATRSAAQTFGLDFVGLHGARYDLVMRKRTAEMPAMQAFLDVLQRAELRRKLEVLAGYDTAETGSVARS